jgi:hypothetical protein
VIIEDDLTGMDRHPQADLLLGGACLVVLA